MKVKEILKNGIQKLNQYEIQDSILKAKMLLTYLIKIPYENLVLYEETEIEIEDIKQFYQYIEDIIKGKPIQYLTNSQNFYGLNFYVDTNVLIPQPDTEILVEEVIQILKKRKQKAKILDICTGSGAIAISIGKNINTQITASDISEKALKVARKNALDCGVDVEFINSNMFEKIKGKFDVIVSNPPYIETENLKKLPSEVKNEPFIALDGGKDGCKFYRILAGLAGKYLNQNGILAVEIGYSQKEKVMNIFEKVGFCEIYSKKDFAKNDRIVVGKWRE